MGSITLFRSYQTLEYQILEHDLGQDCITLIIEVSILVKQLSMIPCSQIFQERRADVEIGDLVPDYSRLDLFMVIFQVG